MADSIIHPPLLPEKEEQQEDSKSWYKYFGFTTVSITHIKESDIHNGQGHNTTNSTHHSFFLPFMGAPQTLDLLFDETPSFIKTNLRVDHQLVHKLNIKKKLYKTREKVIFPNGGTSRHGFRDAFKKATLTVDITKFEQTVETPIGTITYKLSVSATSPGADPACNADLEYGPKGSQQINLNVGNSYLSVSGDGKPIMGVNVGNTYFAATLDAIIFGIKEHIGISTVQFEVNFKPKFNQPKWRMGVPAPSWGHDFETGYLHAVTADFELSLHVQETEYHVAKSAIGYGADRFHNSLSNFHNSSGWKQELGTLFVLSIVTAVYVGGLSSGALSF